jgi:hypothetical protein
MSVMGRVYLGDLETDGRVTLRCVHKKKMRSFELDFGLSGSLL